MTSILIIGAHGRIARVAIDLFLARRLDVRLTLFARNSTRLREFASDPRVRLVEGDALDTGALEAVVPGHDVVYANLSGPLEQLARSIIRAMEGAGVWRLVFISSMGIYDEIPGERHGSMLDPYRKAAAAIESSNLDYTILRPAWLSNTDEIAYGTTPKGRSFKSAGQAVSRRSVADLVVRLCTSPGEAIRHSLGVHREAADACC